MKKVTLFFYIPSVILFLTACDLEEVPFSDLNQTQNSEADILEETKVSSIEEQSENHQEYTPLSDPEQIMTDQKEIPELPIPASQAPPVVQSVKYVCDGGRAYILYEPGITDSRYLCELDAVHTKKPADWSAVKTKSFCRQELEKLILQHNCNIRG